MGPRRRARRPGDVCVLASGGVESAGLLTLYLERGLRVHPLFVRCGYRWEDAELASLRRLLRGLRSSRLMPLAVVEAAGLAGASAGHWAFGSAASPGADAPYDAVYLPGRNLVLLSCAAALCARRGVGRAALGNLRGNPFADSSASFFRRFEALARDSFGRPLRVETPFLRLSKRQVVSRWTRGLFGRTFSCLRPRGGGHCGRCSKCAERLAAA